MTVAPGSVNVCPSDVYLTLDMRHPSTSALLKLSDAVKAEALSIASRTERGCQLQWKVDSTVPATVFHMDCIEAVREAAVRIVGEDKVREVVSGAGHDSCAVSKRCPTSMVFVPSRDGISHNPREYTSPEDW
jgi:acetylornithine deacetylase/succinyl-diaminopimelate desuccinylase-like protein